MHGYDPSGALHGLLRVRSFTQDDVRIKLSTRPENRIGSDERWDKSEDVLRDAIGWDGHSGTLHVVVATVTELADNWANEVATAFKAAGLRMETDLRNEKIGYKVREHALQKVPVQIALGAREAEERSVTIRRHGEDKTRTLPLDEAMKTLISEMQRPGGLR